MIIALLFAIFSIVLNMSVSSMNKIPEKEPDFNINVNPDTEVGQVGLIINKPAPAP